MRPDEWKEAGEDLARLPLAEEIATVGHKDVVTGRVRVNTRVHTDQTFVEATLAEDEVEITRVPIERVVEAPPPIREEDGVIIVSIVAEEAVVETRLVLKEELHLRRLTRHHDVAVPVTLRRQTAEVERDPAPADPSTKEGTP